MNDDGLRKVFAEWLGSMILAATVIGSGIMAANLAGGNDAVALIGNTAATGAILYVLIVGLGPISGAHFNPAVTLAFWLRGEMSIGSSIAFVLAQIIGCILGALLAHVMFDLSVIQLSTHERAGVGQVISEGAATFMLVFAILATLRWRPSAVPAAVALTICAGYWWTASTSFANPAITIARALSDTFAGVRPGDVPGFILGQIIGSIFAVYTVKWLIPAPQSD
ncbi:MAG: aquaporin [Hyphomonas sp.]